MEISKGLKNSVRSYMLHRHGLYVNLSQGEERSLEVLRMVDTGFVKWRGVGSSRITELHQHTGIVDMLVD